MSIPITSPLSYIGVFLMIAGFFLLLSGLNILKIEKISVMPGKRTWIIGLGLTAIGLVFLMSDRAPAPAAVQPTNTVEARVQVVTATPSPTDTHQPPTATSVPPTHAPTIEKPAATGAAENSSLASEQMRALYAALKLEIVKVEPARSLPGDPIKVQYQLANTLSQDLPVPVNHRYSEPYYLAGVIQAWIERLGADSEIPAIPAQIGRDGKRYAAGGSILPIGGGQDPVVIAADERLELANDVDTKDYPPGMYRYYLEYEDLEGKVLQSVFIDFELTSPN